jgi:hypothetical protein
LATPFVLGAYIAGSFLPNCVRFWHKISTISANYTILGLLYRDNSYIFSRKSTWFKEIIGYPFWGENASGKYGELLFPQKGPNRPQIDFQGRVFHEISFFRASYQPLFNFKLKFFEKHWKLTYIAQKKFHGRTHVKFHQGKFFFKYFFLSFWLIFHPLSDSKLIFFEIHLKLACFARKVKPRVIPAQIFFIKVKFRFFQTFKVFGLLIYVSWWDSHPIFHSKLIFSERYSKITYFKQKKIWNEIFLLIYKICISTNAKNLNVVP